MSYKISKVIKSSTTTQANLLPSTSSVTVTSSSESQPPIPLIDTAPPHLVYCLCTSVASSSSNKALSSTIGLLFSSLPAETSPVLETSTTSDTIPSTSQAPKKKKLARKKCPDKAISP
ncbi:hypothetical protein TNCV_4453281 [Trichonephila clavipes]|nr:hypothetical protein TNCV_4453281 [Trichonephila clavipes]